MTRPLLLLAALVLGCSEHDVERSLVGGSNTDAGSDASARPPEIELPDAGAGPAVRWCQALAVLEPVCQRCHSNPTQNGAPFPLVTYDDTHANYYATDMPIWKVMYRAVSTNFMPQMPPGLSPPVEPLTCEQRTTVLGWLVQGANAEGGTDCAESDKTLVDCGSVDTGEGGAGGAGP